MLNCYPINGWTKESIIKHIKENFKGKAIEGMGTGAERCVYLTKDCKKCAVGLFIPAGHAGQKSIGGIQFLLCRFPDLLKVMPLSMSNMLEFQMVHDSLRNESSVERQTHVLIKWINENVSG